MKPRSLTRRLIGGVLLAEFLCAATFSGVAIAHEMHGRRRAFDVMLRGRADSLMGAVQDAEDPDDNVMVDPTELTLPAEDAYAVANPAGRVLGHSPESSPELLAVLESAYPDGYFNFKVAGKSYRALRTPGMRVIDREEKKGAVRCPVTVLYAAPTAHLWHETVEAVRFYVIAGVLLLVVTGLALVWLLRRWLSPLRELAERAGHVSAQAWGFVPPEAALHTRELQPIASSIQKLLHGLRQSFERQRQFTGDAAHELKTSIAVLKSSLQLLSLRPRTVEEYQGGIEEVVVDTERMEDLTERMLALARLEEAPVRGREPVDLALAAQSVAERLRPVAELKQVPIEVTVQNALPVTMPLDDAEILCSNLMMNALQYSSPGSGIAVRVESHAGVTMLLVEDHGEGIPVEALPHVFDRFYRADVSRSRNSGGAGLGLAMCKAIVERCGGTIEIASTPGVGTQVKVTLPAIV
ncbi:cell wall metabolism sensor histidine kinase WalK [Granulicella sp. S156]|uniref:sensor histidine kinase n=1 Tax=Granulicella sp. S156 TaxID=1747224 RepID=UPI00131CE7E3|nr:ATP-binding protein [Granulicella sp. S156]